MDVLCSSEKIIRECSRLEEGIALATTRNTRKIENALQQKIKILEFYIGELISEKQRLAGDIETIKSVIRRTEQTIKSLKYPKDTNLKCTEIRNNVAELRNDNVQSELRKEIEIIDDSRVLLSTVLDELEEQLRRHRSAVHSLESDLHHKTDTLKAENRNDHCWPQETHPAKMQPSQKHELAASADQIRQLHSMAAAEAVQSWQKVDWIRSTQSLLQRGKRELEKAQMLVSFAEESLSSRTSALISQHNRCNESFHKRISQCKSAKSDLEMKLLRTNELVHRMRKCIDETQNTIVANEPGEHESKMRFQRRLASDNPELFKDMVQLTLIENVQQRSQALRTLQTSLKMAQSSLMSLLKIKNQNEAEIEDKIISIKVDEVECLPARSSIHYHAY